jgi:UDP-N-acetyl-D-mannosaminuronate dehydrogenase
MGKDYRSVNIARVNEMKMVLAAMEIDIYEVSEVGHQTGLSGWPAK